MLKAFERREFIEDENLEHMMYYISKCGSMEGRIRSKNDLEKTGLSRVSTMLDRMDNNELMELDAETIKRFIRLVNEKIIIFQAALILKKNKI